MSGPLPVLISIPHGGTLIPAFLKSRVALRPDELFDDGDAFTGEIYDLGEAVVTCVRASVARAIVDLNRSPDDRPPANDDGVVKRATCHGVPVYRPGCELTDGETDELLRHYHVPYHARLRDVQGSGRIRLALDCHSMAAVAPAGAPDPGAPRPLFCLGNRHGATCPEPLLQALRSALAKAFAIGESQVSLNEPFAGGYITRSQGAGAVPWIQVEMNRSFYLVPPWFDRERLRVESGRLAILRGKFLAALRGLRDAHVI